MSSRTEISYKGWNILQKWFNFGPKSMNEFPNKQRLLHRKVNKFFLIICYCCCKYKVSLFYNFYLCLSLMTFYEHQIIEIDGRMTGESYVNIVKERLKPL